MRALARPAFSAAPLIPDAAGVAADGPDRLQYGGHREFEFGGDRQQTLQC